MIEKKILEILDPVVEEIVKLEKRFDALERQPGPVGEAGKDGINGKDGSSPSVDDVAIAIKADHEFIEKILGRPGEKGEAGKDGADGKDVDPEVVAGILKGSDDFVARLKGDTGEKGDPGENGKDGLNGADADPAAVAALLKADAEFVASLQGEHGLQGEKGDRGDNGDNGADADPDAVAKALMRDDAFVKSVTIMLEADPWAAGIYREGKCVSHYNGRLYKAVSDTTDEPGDSPLWKRLGTCGTRDVGGYDEKRVWEAGDIYHKDGATFYFDGAIHRLHIAKAFTERDFEKHVKGMRSTFSQTVKALIERVEQLQAMADGQSAIIADLMSRLDEVQGNK
jgi:hypothetical protein